MSHNKERLKPEDFSNIDIGKGIRFEQINNIENSSRSNRDKCTLFCAVWHGGIKLEVLDFYGDYRIVLTKEDTFLESHIFHDSDGVINRVSHLVEQIKAGAFDRKKTTRERIQKIIESKGLTSYMNNTKWKEFLHAMENELPFVPPYEFKTLFEEEDWQIFRKCDGWKDWDIDYAGDFDDEAFPRNQCYVLEWVILFPRLCKNLGGSLVRIPEIVDETEELQEVLEKYHIPYEINNGYFIVYGYQ